MFTLSYDTNGTQRGVDRYKNGQDDTGREITVDGSGNVYVTGGSEDSSGVRDHVTIKYSP